MKNFKLFITVLAISVASVFTTSASENEPKTINQEIRNEIVSLLGNQLPMELKEDNNVEIYFIVNNKNEVVIMSVDSTNSEIDSYVKNKLNYQIIKVKGIIKGENYRLPLKIKKSS